MNNRMATKGKKIDVNSATREDLETITDIGESRATAILKLRDENGGIITAAEFITLDFPQDLIWRLLKEDVLFIEPVVTEPIAEGNLMTEMKSLFSEFEEKQEKKMDEMKCELREEIEEVKSKASSVKSGRDE